MNKIIVDNNSLVITSNDLYYINVLKEDYDIFINSNIECKIVLIAFDKKYQIHLHLNKNSNLIINSLNKNSSIDLTIDIENNSKATINYSVISNDDSINNFNINHLDNDTTSILNNNGINLSKNKLHFNVNGIITKNLHNVVCSQNNKIINYQDGDSKIIPNLIVDSNDIVANHSAYIGDFDPNIKFYMQSRGLSEEKTNELLYKSILLGKMELDLEKEEFNKIINEWW